MQTVFVLGTFAFLPSSCKVVPSDCLYEWNGLRTVEWTFKKDDTGGGYTKMPLK
jgi:hypothetical protein